MLTGLTVTHNYYTCVAAVKMVVIMGGCVIVSEIGSQITFIGDNLPIKKSDLLLKKPIPIFYMIVI